MNWWRSLKGKVKLYEPLNKHTTFRIGGPAKFFIEPKDIKDLKLLIGHVRKNKLPVSIIGAGSNILVGDKGINNVVVRLNSPFFKRIYFKSNQILVGSGSSLSRVLIRAQEKSLSGFEFLMGIPGTVGGALAMNAGTRDRDIGDLVESVCVMDFNGNIKILNKDGINFGYRKSSLSKYIILSAKLRLKKTNNQKIKDRIKKYLEYRKSTQDLSMPSAGCVFKNPNTLSAGKLIDLCGLKGRRIGQAYISTRHANFILNQGNAKAKDVLRLIDLVRKTVRMRFNITLEPEIKIWQ